MKRLFLTICLMLSVTCLLAQDTIYSVTNRNELMTSTIAQDLRSMLTATYTEDAEREHAGMQPREIDTAEMMNVLAEWLILQTNEEEQKILASAVPAKVLIDENTVTLTSDKDDTIQFFNIKGVRGDESKRDYICEDGTVICLFGHGNGRYTLQVPKMEKIELKKTM